MFKEPLSSEACLGRVEAAAFHHTYLRAGNMKNGGGQGITESQGITVLVDVYSQPEEGRRLRRLAQAVAEDARGRGKLLQAED